MMLHLRYDTRRVDCATCDIKVELLPWRDTGVLFTPFEDHGPYLAQRSDKTTISAMMRVAWDTVGAIIQRVVARRGDGDVLDGLTQIGIDELSYRRHHEYVTVVVDHKRGRVVWAKPGKNADTLKAFFDELGPECCAKLEAVTIDMSKRLRHGPQACYVIPTPAHSRPWRSCICDEERRSCWCGGDLVPACDLRTQLVPLLRDADHSPLLERTPHRRGDFSLLFDRSSLVAAAGASPIYP